MMDKKFTIQGRPAMGGVVEGEALVCPESIQGWAGVNDRTGQIIERGHSQEGVCIDGRILVLPCSKGSNGWSSHFHSAAVEGFCPAGWLFTRIDSRAGVAAAVLKIPTIEVSYKNDEYHDPLINHYHALALGLATQEEIDTITKYAFQVNDILSQYLLGFNIRLIDFKLEFGRLPDGSIVLADEISPDTCRFWDATTGAHLDKDLFRRDLGGEEEAYREVMKRLLGE